MMHGYLAFDAAGNQLAPFRTWRNTMTRQGFARGADARCSHFNIPQRWSIAHLYQAMLEPRGARAATSRVLTTLAGYLH